MIEVQNDTTMTEQTVWGLLEQVPDPEIPVLNVIDLGIVRKVEVHPGQNSEDVEITILLTPTYMGCPAMDMISMNIRLVLLEYGFRHIRINTILSPAWTTAWMSVSGKAKLKAYGVAPPLEQAARIEKLFTAPLAIPCPLCDSANTRLISEFGSTACKSLYQCNDCKEPFDYFKCH